MLAVQCHACSTSGIVYALGCSLHKCFLFVFQSLSLSLTLSLHINIYIYVRARYIGICIYLGSAEGPHPCPGPDMGVDWPGTRPGRALVGAWAGQAPAQTRAARRLVPGQARLCPRLSQTKAKTKFETMKIPIQRPIQG